MKIDRILSNLMFLVLPVAYIGLGKRTNLLSYYVICTLRVDNVL
jgi:hypothetical protein